MNGFDLNERLCDFFKVPFREKPVSGFTLTVRHLHLPQLTVQYEIYKEDHMEPMTAVELFDLIPHDETFNLDRMVKKAQGEVRRCVSTAASRHLKEMCRPTWQSDWVAAHEGNTA